MNPWRFFDIHATLRDEWCVGRELFLGSVQGKVTCYNILSNMEQILTLVSQMQMLREMIYNWLQRIKTE